MEIMMFPIRPPNKAKNVDPWTAHAYVIKACGHAVLNVFINYA